MDISNLQEAENYTKAHARRKRWHQMVTALSCLVVFCTTYLMILPAITMEKYACGLEEHMHTMSCFAVTDAEDWSCLEERQSVDGSVYYVPAETHQHTDECYWEGDENHEHPICGKADFVLHTHDAFCYDADSNLVCPLSERSEYTPDPYVLHYIAYGNMDLDEEIPPAIDENEMENSGTDSNENKNSVTGNPGDSEAENGNTGSTGESEAENGDTDSADDNVVENDGADSMEGNESENSAVNIIDVYETENGDMSNTDSSEAGSGSDDSALVSAEATVYNFSGFFAEDGLEPIGEEHQHQADCYDSDGKLTCTLLEVARHQHAGACISAEKLVCDIVEHTHDDSCFTKDILDEKVPLASGKNVIGGTVDISLLYGDETAQDGHPDGVSYYTHSTMSGFIKLEPKDLVADLTDMTVTLTIPKQYVEKDSINIPEFTTNSEITAYEIRQITEEADNYCISIFFSAYDKTQTLVLPFALSFLDDVVPDNYQLPVTATVSCGDSIFNSTEPNIYKPLYKEWGIDKFVNSNRLDAFRQDGTQVVVTPLEENGNPYLDDLTYVDFSFMVNSVINLTSNLNDFRDASEVTLTDRLPAYTDKDGKTCIAVFDSDVNPGWTLSEDGTSVSKIYTGENSADVLVQIYNDELHLRFPGLKLNSDDNGNLSVDLINTVSLLAIPSNEAEGENRPIAEDSLRFVMTNDSGAQGRFTKKATKGNIYDVDVYKTNPYSWAIRLSNEKPQPLQHIFIQDRKIMENGEVVLSGLDEALKFVRLDSNLSTSVLPEGKSFADIVDKVVAYYTDGTTQEFSVTEVDTSGNFSVAFDENNICDGYEIIFNDSYKMYYNEAVGFMAYTVYRDPKHTHITEGQEKITYRNSARSVNWYTKNDEPVFVYLTAEHSYDMLPITENLQVTKETQGNSGTENNMAEKCYSYSIGLKGSLLTPEQKVYDDLRIVDLLPNEVYYVKIDSCGSGNRGYLFDEGTRYQPEIVENYHNSGRTAVIFHLKYDLLQHHWDNDNGFASVVFQVKIRSDVQPGTVRNHVYVVGNNLEEYTGKTGGAPDIYDLNNNGRTDDMIAYAHSDAVIIAAQSIYAEKFIAPANSNNWTKQGLSLKVGSNFDYLLKVTNETAEEHTGLVVYDTLPQIGDNNIFSNKARNSEFAVRLREAITPPEGYTVYYTTQPEVYQKPMSEMVSADIWSNSVTDWSAVTAFKLVANDTATLPGQSSFQVRIPVCIPAELSENSMKLLAEKTYQNQDAGTMAYLEAINSFGFKTDQAAAEKESNTVWARIPFAGFTIKKVDSKSGNGLVGAEFTLTKDGSTVISKGTSDEQGLIIFRDLTEGAYTLKETKAPTGYMDRDLSMAVEIRQNPTTMGYTVTLNSKNSGVGSNKAPFLIENVSAVELPNTGGPGTTMCTLGGLLLICIATPLLYRNTKRKRGETLSP